MPGKWDSRAVGGWIRSVRRELVVVQETKSGRDVKVPAPCAKRLGDRYHVPLGVGDSERRRPIRATYGTGRVWLSKTIVIAVWRFRTGTRSATHGVARGDIVCRAWREQLPRIVALPARTSRV